MFYAERYLALHNAVPSADRLRLAELLSEWHWRRSRENAADCGLALPEYDRELRYDPRFSDAYMAGRRTAFCTEVVPAAVRLAASTVAEQYVSGRWTPTVVAELRSLVARLDLAGWVTRLTPADPDPYQMAWHREHDGEEDMTDLWVGRSVGANSNSDHTAIADGPDRGIVWAPTHAYQCSRPQREPRCTLFDLHAGIDAGNYAAVAASVAMPCIYHRIRWFATPAEARQGCPAMAARNETE